MSLNLAVLLRDSARAFPGSTALTLGERNVDYRSLDEQARRFAGGLLRLGIKPGQHVAILLPNVPQFSVAYFGGHYAATPIVPLNVLLTADELAYHLDDSDAVALVTWADFLPQAEAAFARSRGCKHLIVAGRSLDGTLDRTRSGGSIDMDALLFAAPPVTELPATMPDDTAVVLYTSGTTGRPKGAELTHFNLFYNAEYASGKLLPLDENTVGLVCLPLFHSFGQTVMHNGLLRVGARLILMPRFTPDAAMALMARHRVTLFSGVPTMYFSLLNFPNAAEYDLSSLKYCKCGGAPMPMEVMRAFDARYGVSILEGYGLSETSPIASFNVLGKPKKVGSIGLPIGGVELKLVDAEDKTVNEVGKPGEICIKGHNVMKRYYKKPDETAEAIRDGWFHTGDIGERDADGYYTIVDRKKDMIIRGGYNVYPREIEEVLYAHPSVAEAAVVGVPHERHGEEVKAIVAFKQGQSATSDELIEHCKARLAAYKYPRLVEVMTSLPKGPTGKILKRELRTKSGS